MANFASVSGNSLPNSWTQAIDESRKASFSVQEEAEFQKHSMKLSGNRERLSVIVVRASRDREGNEVGKFSSGTLFSK